MNYDLLFRYCNNTHQHDQGPNSENAKTTVPQFFQSNLLCAGDEFGEYGSCHGDSGGPLLAYEHENADKMAHFVQLGVVHGSTGDCGDPNQPGIYARIEDPEVWTFITSTTRLYEQMEEVPTIENV